MMNCAEKRAVYDAIADMKVIDGLRYLAEVCSGRIAVDVSEVVKSAKNMQVEAVTVNKLVFEPASALRAYELIGRFVGMWREGAADRLKGKGGDMAEVPAVPALDVPAVGDGWTDEGMVKDQPMPSDVALERDAA